MSWAQKSVRALQEVARGQTVVGHVLLQPGPGAGHGPCHRERAPLAPQKGKPGSSAGWVHTAPRPDNRH